MAAVFFVLFLAWLLRDFCCHVAHRLLPWPLVWLFFRRPSRSVAGLGMARACCRLLSLGSSFLLRVRVVVLRLSAVA